MGNCCNDKKYVYIVLTQTGTILSKILKAVTGAKYNHSSISLEEDLSCMYSFGRKYPRNPFIGGFVKESLTSGTFQRFSSTDALIFKVEVSTEQYDGIKRYLTEMYQRKCEYHYNYCGLLFAAWGKIFHRERYFYCSEFIKDILMRFGIVNNTDLPYITKPIDLLSISEEKIYSGKLKDYEKSRMGVMPCVQK